MKPSSLPFFLLHCLLSKNLLYHVDPIVVFLYQGLRLCHLGETRLFAEISFVSNTLCITLFEIGGVFSLPIHSELQSIWNTFRISDGMSSFRYTALAFQSQFRNHIWCWERSKLPKWNFNNHTDGERKTNAHSRRWIDTSSTNRDVSQIVEIYTVYLRPSAPASS